MGDAVRHLAREWYIPYRDAITPANRGDAVRHGIVRAAFLTLLNKDVRVLRLYATWAHHGGLLPRMRELQAALRALAALVPLAPGTQAKELPDRLPAVAGPTGVVADPAAVARALAAVAEANRALADRLEAAGEDERLGLAMDRDAKAFVRGLGLPWTWLVGELVTQYALWVCQAGLYDARYAEHLHGGLLPASVRALPRGKVPDKDAETLRRYALWFYRVRVRGEAVRAVARDEFGAEAVDDRARDVRGGVRRAGDLLALGRFKFGDRPA